MRREAPVGPSTRAHLLLISLRCQLAVASVQNSPLSVSWEKYVITTPGAAWPSVRFATEGPLGMERSAWGCTAGDWLARYPATPSASCSAIFVRALQAERERKGATRHTGGSPAGPQENWGSARPPGSLRTGWRTMVPNKATKTWSFLRAKALWEYSQSSPQPRPPRPLPIPPR